MVVTEVAEDEAGRMLARREVELLLNGRGWNIADLGRATGVDLGTIGDFLNGKRWPQRSTQTKIEAALDLAPGTIAAWSRGEQPPESVPVSGEEQDAEVLLSLPADALDGLNASEREEAIAAAKATLLERIRDIRRRLDG